MRERDHTWAHVDFGFAHEAAFEVVAAICINRRHTRAPNSCNHCLPDVRLRKHEDGLFPACTELGLSLADYSLRHGHGRHLQLCDSEME